MWGGRASLRSGREAEGEPPRAWQLPLLCLSAALPALACCRAWGRGCVKVRAVTVLSGKGCRCPARACLSGRASASSRRGRAAPCPTRVQPPPASQPASYFVRRVPAEAGLPRAGGGGGDPRPPDTSASPLARGAPRRAALTPPSAGVTSRHRRPPGREAPGENPRAPSPIASPRVAGERGDGSGRSFLCRRRGFSDLQSFASGGNRSISFSGFVLIFV